MLRVSPGKQEQFERVQYFVDTYLKDIPVLGLEYVVEEQAGPSYLYTCMLCNKEYDWQETIVHLTDPEHTDIYVTRHHSELKITSINPTKDNLLLMKAAKTIHTKFGHGKICVKNSNAGNPDEVAVPSPIGDNKNNGTLPSTGNALQTKHKKGRLTSNSVPQKKGKDRKRQKMLTQGEKCTKSIDKFQRYVCTLCHITCCTAVSMCDHVNGNKHKSNLLPQEQDDVNRLSYFLNTHMKKDPIVGLEYVMEVKQGSLYKFSCQLCGVVDVTLRKIVTHITDSTHMLLYAWQHHSDLFLPFDSDLQHIADAKVLRDISLKIILLHGRKEIQVINTTVGGPTESALFPGSDRNTRKAVQDTLPTTPEGDGKTKRAFEDTLPSKREGDRKTRKAFMDTLSSKREGDGETRKAFEDTLSSKHESRSSHSKWRPLSYREKGLDESHESYRYSKRPKVSKSDDPSLAKRSRLSPEGDWGALPSRPHISKHRSSQYNESHATRMDCTTAMQELEFRTNEEFLKYLSNFVISNDEDAVFIQMINLNCIRAVTNFQVEETERQKTTYHSETPLVHTSRTAQEIPHILENKTESHLWGSETTMLKDTSNPPSDSMPENEVTDFFFSSIKNIDESEVVGVFQKIATTNPEFQGMDIPSVIRFLKNSGRLKKP